MCLSSLFEGFSLESLWSISSSGYNSAGVTCQAHEEAVRKLNTIINQFLHTTFHLDEAATQFQMFVLVHVHLEYEQPSSVQRLSRHAK
jgi:hypothetical protein